MAEQWQQLLTSMPARDIGGRVAVEPAASGVVISFLQNVFGSFAERASCYREAGFEAHVEPSAAAVIDANTKVGLVVFLPGQPGGAHTLHCQRLEGLEMRLLIDREQLWQEWTSFALDREPESPWGLVESSLADFDSKVRRLR